MPRVDTARMETVGTLILMPGVFALLLTVGYHLVSLFVQLMAHEYSAVAWHMRTAIVSKAMCWRSSQHGEDERE
jgi:hypothetical protein